MQQRLGITIGLEGGSLAEALELCRHAAERGYTDAWSAEVAGPDGFSPLAALAATEPTLRLGTAIVPAYTRPPALLAMHAAALADLSKGRFVLGLGTSSSIIVERWMGGRFEAPLARLRDYVAVLRSALAGEKVDHVGTTTNVSGFRLTHDPRHPVPLYLAALGPEACRLAGAIADGVIFFLKSPQGVRQALGWVAEGAASAGRDAAEIDCILRVPVVCGAGRAETGVMLRRLLVGYAMVDVYNRSLAVQGFAGEASLIRERWNQGDRAGAAQAVSDELLAAMFLAGDEAACREGVAGFRAAGVRTPVLLPLTTEREPAAAGAAIEATIDALAP